MCTLNKMRISAVAPHAGAWVEIAEQGKAPRPNKSLPTRERGLKYRLHLIRNQMCKVAPLVGAWVEIKEITLKALDKDVAPHAGAWVEIP